MFFQKAEKDEILPNFFYDTSTTLIQQYKQSID